MVQSPVITAETLPSSERSGGDSRTSAKLRPRPRSLLKYGGRGGLPTGLRVVATSSTGMTSRADCFSGSDGPVPRSSVTQAPSDGARPAAPAKAPMRRRARRETV